MCYYTLVNQLHLPYMLCQDDNSLQTVYLQIACINASCKILNQEVTLCTFNPVTACYRIGNFMTLIAGITLILTHVVSHCSQDGSNLLAHQRLGDRAAVERALECMQNMSELQQDVLAAKCVFLLRGLLAIEAEAARGRACHIQRQDWTDKGVGGGDDVMVIKMLYASAVKIVLEHDASAAPLGPREDEPPLERVTIGSLGSVQLKNPKAQPHGTGGDTARFVAHQAEVSSQQSPQDQAQAADLNPLMQHDQLFPDAAAGMDDWVFQGFDTAFFDAMLRRVGDQPSDDAGGEALEASGTFT